MKNRVRVEIICMVGTRYTTLPQKTGSQRSSRLAEQPFSSSEAVAGVVRDEVVAAVAGAPWTVTAAGEAARVEVASTGEQQYQ